jgi:hypothetical protein
MEISSPSQCAPRSWDVESPSQGRLTTLTAILHRGPMSGKVIQNIGRHVKRLAITDHANPIRSSDERYNRREVPGLAIYNDTGEASSCGCRVFVYSELARRADDAWLASHEIAFLRDA